jgi:adenylate cyclase
MSSDAGNTGLWHTMLFVDVCGSTKLYESLGNTRAQSIIAKTLALLSQAAVRNQGTVVKSIGDEVMCTFPMAHHAVTASLDMQKSLREAVTRGDIELPTLAVRTGFHCGPVIADGADVFGDAVNVAARVTSYAKPGQILVSRQTVLQLPRHMQGQVRYIGNVHLKGKRESLELFEVIWEEENLTRMQQVEITSVGAVHLTAKFGDLSMDVNELRTSIVMGRGEENDIVVLDPLASRLHARIEYRRGRFVLIDQSLNGTFVSMPGRKEFTLRREELQLSGSGLVALGKSTQVLREHCIEFNVHLGPPGGAGSSAIG